MGLMAMQAVIVCMLLLLFLLGIVCFYRLAAALLYHKPRIRWSSLKRHVLHHEPSRLLLAGLRIGTVNKERWEEWGQLLRGAGIALHPLWYAVFKRVLFLALLGAGTVLWFWGQRFRPVLPAEPRLTAAAAGVLAALLLSDRYILTTLRTYRSQRIVEEIYALSNHLLYFSGSKMNLHGKLARCLPYTKLLRTEWHALLNEWYRDPEAAVSGFRRKAGTDEAYTFAETLQAMRLYDGEAYYDLLRQRVRDFKEKLELIQDSRKESLSYALFVLAGIPIMYTFQLFIYPWVEEGRRLFDSLH